LVPWKARKVTLKIPKSQGERFAAEYQNRYKDQTISVPEKISFEVKPTLNTPYGPVLRVQDYMVLRIINNNKWKKPIYFAVTVAKKNMLGELQEYLRMDGLALKLVPYKNWRISPENLERNLTTVYKYRGLQDPSVYYDKNIMGLLQNYRTAYLQVSEYHVRSKNMDKVKMLMADMEKNIPSQVIPWTNKYLRLIRDSYSLVTETITLDSLYNLNYSAQNLQMIGENLYRFGLGSYSENIFETLYASNPNNVQALSILVDIYEQSGKYDKGIQRLEEWLERNPNDPQAKLKLTFFKSKAVNLE
jgi:tetratricopeptide (TPR) repeat protein